MNRSSQSVEERFWKYVKKTPRCWLWTGPVNKARMGYGIMCSIGGRGGVTKASHRVSWELHFGEVPEGAFVLHKCDRPSCVNPKHLFLGDHTDNMRDMVQKDRHYKALVTVDQVVGIRKAYDEGESVGSIALRLKMKSGTVWKIAKRVNWKSVA